MARKNLIDAKEITDEKDLVCEWSQDKQIEAENANQTLPGKRKERELAKNLLKVILSLHFVVAFY